MKTCYICEYCGRRYKDKREALDCETSHARKRGISWVVRGHGPELERNEIDKLDQLGVRLESVSGCLHVTVGADSPEPDEKALNLLKGALIDMLIKINERLKEMENPAGRP